MTKFSEFCASFGTQVSNVTRIGRRYFYNPHQLPSADVFSVGIYLGEDSKVFRPTSALIRMLGEHVPSVVVSEEATWLFICGKDILMEGVLERVPAQVGSVMIIKDEEDNTLGYGVVKAPYDPDQKHRVFCKNRLDIGEYLRREH